MLRSRSRARHADRQLLRVVVRFEVRVVRRDDGSRRRCGNESPYEDPDDFNFRFTPDFDLDVFHQIWFFGDFPRTIRTIRTT